MYIFIFDTLQLLKRHTLATLRLPIWIAVTLIQPVIWLTIFGQLFQKVVEIPGFDSNSYIAFLTPGVVIMTAMFGAAWSGMGLIYDLNLGVMDRLLSTPVYRGAIIAARVLHASLTVLVQSIIILVLGYILGAKIESGIFGILGILVSAILIGSGFSALSSGLALLTKREENLIAIINFFGLPLTFLSAAFMSEALIPNWVKIISIFNPVNWAVSAARNSISGDNWSAVTFNCFLLLVFALLTYFFATLAFKIYQKTH